MIINHLQDFNCRYFLPCNATIYALWQGGITASEYESIAFVEIHRPLSLAIPG